jgi:hypothetical protein
MFDIFKKRRDKKVFTYRLDDKVLEFNEGQDYYVYTKETDKFLSIRTYSGLGRFVADYTIPSNLLNPNTDNKTLGETILTALSKSRTITDERERVDLFDLNKGKERYKNWYTSLMQTYNYKTKKALFKDMKSCSIWLFDRKIKISPSYHEKLEAWSGIRDADVILSLENTPEEIGAGLRLAFSRCTGVYVI